MLPLIIIDVGNTSTAIGLWQRGKVSRIAHVDGDFTTARRHVADLARLGASRVAYLSVVPKLDPRWRATAKSLGLRFHQITHRDFARARDGKLPQCGIRLDYARPETIGADRLADAVGAVSRFGAPVLVMDFGTALTAAVVTKDRRWIGGAIAPGFPLMSDYLFERTAKLPRMRLGDAKLPKIGRSTEEAMNFGALVGYRGMVREITAQLQRNFRTDFKLIATGGYARWVLKGSGMDFAICPDLTLFGAGVICENFF